jgi:hypothetical protein
MSEGDGDGCDAVLLLGLAFCCLIVMGFSLRGPQRALFQPDRLT